MNRQTATFAAGCFWGVEDLFRKVPGVLEVTSGYTGGDAPNPTYEQVCTGTTGHAEAVQVVYDADEVSYDALLAQFWKIHDPTQINCQGPDIGSQYRSVIFTHTPEQKVVAEQSRDTLTASGTYAAPIATDITEATTFYPAEEYHQRYVEKHGGAACRA